MKVDRKCKATINAVCNPCPKPALVDRDICPDCLCRVRHSMRQTLLRYGETELALELGLTSKG